MRRSIAAAWVLCATLLSGTANAALDPGAIYDGWRDGLGRLGGGLGDGLGRLGSGLSEGLGRGLNQSLGRLSHRYLFPTEGTTSFEEAVEFQGVGRMVLYIRPELPSTTPAPAVVLLHYHGGTRSDIANMTRIAELARDFGAWIIVPEANNRKWNDDPAALQQTHDDVGFLAKVIQTAAAQHPIDPKRVYMAGMSNGGFMATRFACERPQLIAAAASVVATMRQGQSAACQPSRAVPMTFMLGTSDLQVSYARTSQWALLSGPDTLQRWLGIHGCAPAQVSSTPLPDLDPKDGTTTRVLRSAGCSSGGAVEMYVVEGGGHTWPQGESGYVFTLGRTARDFSGTLAAWTFFENFQLP